MDVRQTRPHDQPGRKENADLFAHDQSGNHSKRYPVGEDGTRIAGYQDAGFGQGKERDNHVGHPGMQTMLELLQRGMDCIDRGFQGLQGFLLFK
jgi:hypothetical protein